MTLKEKVIFSLGFCLLELNKRPTVLRGKSSRTKQGSYRLKQIKWVFMFLFCPIPLVDSLTMVTRNPMSPDQEQGEHERKECGTKPRL